MIRDLPSTLTQSLRLKDRNILMEEDQQESIICWKTSERGKRGPSGF